MYPVVTGLSRVRVMCRRHFGNVDVRHIRKCCFGWSFFELILGENTLSDVKYARHILIYHTEAIENNSEWYYHNYLDLRYASPEFLMISENCRLMEIWRTLLSSYVNNFQRLEILLLRDNYYSTSWLSSQNEIVCTCSFVVYNKKCVFSLISTIL